MTRFLLDSHVVLWLSGQPTRLPADLRAALADPDHEVLVSSATLWELNIKAKLGRLELPANFRGLLRQQGMEELPVAWVHAEGAAQLPLLHGDPFDRMLVAQASAEGLTLVTQDAAVLSYRTAVPLSCWAVG